MSATLSDHDRLEIVPFVVGVLRAAHPSRARLSRLSRVRSREAEPRDQQAVHPSCIARYRVRFVVQLPAMELDEKTLREILREEREESERHAEQQREQSEQHAERQREEFQRHLEIVRRDFKADLENGLAETRHHMGILTEGLRSDIRAIAEGYDALRQEIGGVREQLADLQERVTRLEGQVVALRDMTADLQERVIGLEGQVVTLTHSVAAIQSDIEIIKTELSAVRTGLPEKADREELLVLEGRVAKLEEAVRDR